MTRQGFIHQLIGLSRRGLLFLRKRPTYILTFGRWHVSRWARKGGLRRRPWSIDGSAFWSQLNLDMQPLVEAAAAAEHGNKDASCVLLDYFRHRTTPRFFFTRDDRSWLSASVSSKDRAATIDAADQIARRTFHFRGQPPVTFNGRVAWTHCPQGNTDWMWDLNRHFYLITLGRALWYTDDARYGRVLTDLLTDWLMHNPSDESQPNWASPFEVACRVDNWLWTYHLAVNAGVLDASTHLELLRGLWAHGAYLDACLELHVPNNHLLLEAKALSMLGLLFPEFKQAERWQNRGLRVLWQQVMAQVCLDGVHGERTTLYHRIIAGELLELLVLLENNDIAIPPEIVEAFGRMVEFELWITKPDGTVPLLGDSALEDTHLRFSAARGGPAFLRRGDLKSAAPPLDEMGIWLLGFERVEQYLGLPAAKLLLNSRAFPEGGYFVMRCGQDSGSAYLAFDCGSFGYPPAPGHGHSDALSVELYANGHTLLLDPGVYGYFLGVPWRSFFRSTRAHNTVVVDGLDQSLLLDNWRVYRPARTTLHWWVTSPTFDFADGSHDGYTRLRDPVVHRRQILFVKGAYWVIVDRLEGSGTHHFDVLFHLPAESTAKVDPASSAVDVTVEDGPGLVIAPVSWSKSSVDVVCGETDPIQGWVSLYSGQKEPAPVVSFSQQTKVPAISCVVLYPYLPGASPTISVAPLAVDDDRAVGMRIFCGDYEDLIMIHSSGQPAFTGFEEFQTDARIACVRRCLSEHALSRVLMGGGRQLSAAGRWLIDEPECQEVIEYVE